MMAEKKVYNEQLLVCGSNKYGQIGLGSDPGGVNSFHRISSPESFISKSIKQVSCGTFHTIFVTEDDEIYGCGWNGDGRIGLGNFKQQITEISLIEGPKEFVGKVISKVECSDHHTMYLTQDHEIWSVGFNDKGQLALGNHITQSVPQQVAFEPFQKSKVIDIVCGREFNLFLTEDHKLYSCGDNQYGQLGLGHTENKNVPFLVEGIRDKKIVKMRSGFYHSVLLTEDKELYVFGRNAWGQLGLDIGDTSRPTKITYLNKIILNFSCGESHTVILTEDGSLYSCGHNKFGQLGIGNNSHQNKLVPINFFTRAFADTDKCIVDVNCGGCHSAFITNTNEVWMCGKNNDGRLGIGSTDDANEPQLVPHETLADNTRRVNVICGSFHTVILLDSGLGLKNDNEKQLFEDFLKLVTITSPIGITTGMSGSNINGIGTPANATSGIQFDTILVADNERFPVCRQLIATRLPLFFQQSQLVQQTQQMISTSGTGSIDQRNNKKQKLAQLTHKPSEVNISHLSSGAVKLIIDYCVTDRLLVDELQLYTSINQSVSPEQVLVEVFRWVSKSHASRNNNKTFDSLRRFSTLILSQIIKSVNQNSAVSIYNSLTLQEDEMGEECANAGSPYGRQMNTLSSVPATQFELLRQHLIGYFHKCSVDKTFGQLRDYSTLNKQTLTEILVQGYECKLLDVVDIMVPSSTFRDDMTRLFHETQLRRDGDVVLVLDRQKKNLLYTHKVILACRCDYFRNEFASGMREQQQSEVELFSMGFLNDDEDDDYYGIHRTDDNNIIEDNEDGDIIDESDEVTSVTSSPSHRSSNRRLRRPRSVGRHRDDEEDDDDREERVKVIRQFIEYLYTGNIIIDESNAVAMLNLLNYFSLPINHPLCHQCQSVIIDQVDSQSVLQIMKAFIINKNNPYPVLEEACIRTCVKQWRALHDTYSDKQLIDMLSLELYLKINRQALTGKPTPGN